MKTNQLHKLIKFIKECDYKMPLAICAILCSAVFVLSIVVIIDLVRILGRG